MEEIQQTVLKEVIAIPDRITEAPGSVIAVGGTASTLAADVLDVPLSELWQHSPVPLAISDIEDYWHRLAAMSVDEITEKLDISQNRASILTGGTVILLEVLKALNAEKIILSNKGLRWGLLIDDIVKDTPL